ncbi:hypothetical protein BBJ28_00002577 [Nothophytophthora sp. Chile5]|nr:hypothetical protein BBJ28_00002577 [Nothophytophthora sp. Chile5]
MTSPSLEVEERPLTVGRKRLRVDDGDEPVRRRRKPRARSGKVDVTGEERGTLQGSPSDVADSLVAQVRTKQAEASVLPDLSSVVEPVSTPVESCSQEVVPGNRRKRRPSEAAEAAKEDEAGAAPSPNKNTTCKRARRPPLGVRRSFAPNRALFGLAKLGIVRCKRLRLQAESAGDGEETEDESLQQTPRCSASNSVKAPGGDAVDIPVLPIDPESCECIDSSDVEGGDEQWQVHSPPPYPGFDPSASSSVDDSIDDASLAPEKSHFH